MSSRKSYVLAPGGLMRLCLLALAALVCIGLMTNPVLAQGLDNNRVKAAVKKGVEYLKGLQKDDGSWCGTLGWEKKYPYGTTALCLLTIVKGGEPKNSPAVKKALNYLLSKKWRWVYDASTLILALAALVEDDEPEEKEEEESKPGEEKDLRTSPIKTPEKEAKKRMKKLNPKLRNLIKEAVAYLVKHQKKEGVWRYPGGDLGGATDASNTQYTMMAFFAARRLGVKVPGRVFAPVAEYFIRKQEASGPEVKGWRVPGVDLCMKDLKNFEKEWAKKFNKLLKEEKKKAKKEGKEFKGLGGTAVPKANPYDDPALIGKEIPKFHARGWSYVPLDVPRGQGPGAVPQFMVDVTGSMTCSGIISCMLCKANLEKTGWYKKNGKKLEKAIRDGLAWLAHNWKTDKNPGASAEDSWRYYYFYAVERAAVLTLLQKIGPHDWHTEIGGIILSEQQGNGSWNGAKAAPVPNSPKFPVFEHGPMWNTCFAILFLKKATAPIISKETIIYTGEGLLDGSNKKDDEEKE